MRSRLVPFLVMLGSAVLFAQTPPAAPPRVPTATAPTGGSVRPPVGPEKAPQLSAAEIREYLQQAAAHQKEGRFQKARDLVRMVLQDDPGNPEANLIAGEMLIEDPLQPNYDAARDHFKAVLKTDPSSFRANLGLGKIWIANRMWQQARPFLETAEKVAPPDRRAEAGRLLAVVLTESGMTTEGIKRAEQATRDDPNDLAAAQILAEARLAAAIPDPNNLIHPALTQIEGFITKATDALAARPTDRTVLERLSAGYTLLHNPGQRTGRGAGALQIFYFSLNDRDALGRPIDRLLPGKGPEAAATLVRMAEASRQQALLALLVNEHSTVELLKRAVSDDFDPRNVAHLKSLAATYQQIQDLTARIAGNAVYSDPALTELAVDVCHKILEIKPDDEETQKYLSSVGAAPGPAAPPASQPAAPTTLPASQ
jgi:hypothetical protein